MSIVTRILVLIAAALLLVAAGGIFNGFNLRQKRLAEVKSDTMQLARIAALDMDRILEGTQQLLSTLAKLPAEQGWDRRACSLLEAITTGDSEYDHVMAVDSAGRILCSSGQNIAAGTLMADRTLQERVLTSGDFTVGTYGTGMASGHGVLRVAYPVADRSGATVGAVHAGINIAWLNAAVDLWQFGEKAALAVADHEGTLIARHPGSRGIGEPIEEQLRPYLASSGVGSAEIRQSDGRVRMFGYAPADAGPARGIAVFVEPNHTNVLADIDRSIWRSVAVTFVAFVFSVILAAIYVRLLVDRPFHGLLSVAARWQSGEWSARVGQKTGIPEFDRLASAFDGMATDVLARDRSLLHRDTILHAITKCASELVRAGTVGEAIPYILKTIGEAVDADRIAVLEYQAAGPTRKLYHAWHGPGSPSELRPEYFAGLPREEHPDVARWLSPLRERRMLAATRSEVQGVARAIFDSLGILSILRAPILVDGVLWGELSTNDCRSERYWTPTETDAVSVLADLIGASITRERQLEALSNADEVVRGSSAILFRLAISGSARRMVYISDNVALLGYEPARFMADPDLLRSLVHPDDRPAVFDSLRTMDDGASEGTTEFRLANTAGEYRWMDNRYRAIRNDQGDLVEIVGVLVDITERKQAEEKLQFANTVLTTQRETSPDAILVVDADKHIISFNRRFVELWRVPPAIVEEGDDEKVLAAVAGNVRDSDSFLRRVQYLYDHPDEFSQDDLETTDGRFIDRHTAPMRTASGRYLGRVWYFRDVTERHKAMQAIADSEVRFRTILQAGGDGVVVIDGETRRIVLGNEALCRLTGYDHAELTSLTIDSIYPANEMAAVEQRISGALHGEHMLGWDVHLRRKDGREILVDVSTARMDLGGKAFIVAAYRDITDRKRIEAELQRERDFSTAMIDSLPGIFFVFNGQGRLVRFNAGMTDATGLSATELMGIDALHSVEESDRGLAAAKIRDTLLGDHPVSAAEIGVHHTNGTSRRYLMNAVRVSLPEGPGIMGVGIDVTESRRIEKALHASEQRFRTIFASVSDGIFVRDIDTGGIIEANPSVCDMFGYTREEILHCDFADLSSGVEPYTATEASIRLANARSDGMQRFEWQSRKKDGQIFFTEITLRKVTFGETECFLSTIHDVTERKRNEERILQMARFDNLTGLANRAVFADALQIAIAEAYRGAHQGFAVLYLDLDHFKDVNDTLGHPIGDELLKSVAKRLRATVRETDTVARFGGDEFAVLQSEIEEPTDAGLLAERLLETLNQPYTVEGNDIRCGTSIGIAVFGPDSTTAEALLSKADVALYRAKAEGRGTYRFFTDAMDSEVRTRVAMGNDLRLALGSDQLFVAYQPQVEGSTGRIVGMEALARWRHPQRGLIPPSEFIPVAERNGLIVPLGHWILWEACRQARVWLNAGIDVPVMGVNLSALQFKAPEALEADIRAALAANGLQPGQLELELTETVLMDTSQHHNDVLVSLRESGVRLAIDDFGTGYSSLDYLRRFPVDRIKVAQDFIFDLEAAPGNAAIVRAAIGLARELGASVLAEGVETESQLKLLQSWGCRDIQGYYFAKALPAAEMEPLLRRGRIEAPRGEAA